MYEAVVYITAASILFGTFVKMGFQIASTANANIGYYSNSGDEAFGYFGEVQRLLHDMQCFLSCRMNGIENVLCRMQSIIQVR
jgi:hypothetical protein